LTGVRRCGKSTLLQMFSDELLQTGVAKEQIQFYNFEDLETLALGDIFQIHTHIKNKLVADKMNYIFLDEVQNVKDFQRLVDSLFIKENCDVYITGSNAHLLSGELATLLTGRYIETEVLPFSYDEYLSFLDAHSKKLREIEESKYREDYLFTNDSNSENNNIYPQKVPKNESFSISQDNSLRFHRFESLKNFVYYGGMPEVYNLLINDPKQSDIFVKSVLNTIIEKDIFTRNDIRNKAVFQKIIDFVLDSVGKYVSANSISNAFKNEKIAIRNETVVNYLSYLNDAMLLYSVPRYDIKGKGLLQSLNKFYLSDMSFRRIRLGKSEDEDVGRLLENAVYLELRRRYEKVYVGKFRDMEVDFVVRDHDGYTSYYQVAWTTMHSDETLQRELAPLNAIKDSNPKYLLTTDRDFDPVYNGIRKLNVVNWLLDPPKSV
jgi:predicted AAA+ superfamily ATPase